MLFLCTHTNTTTNRNIFCIFATWISVTIPVVVEFKLLDIELFVVSIPILDPDSPLIAVVLKPDMMILSCAFKLSKNICCYMMDLSNKSCIVSINSCINWLTSLPDTLLTDTLRPPPFVFVLSNIAESPTL